MTSPDVPEAIWINQDEVLAHWCEQWSRAEFLAMDTEFVRTTTFFPQAGLIQVADDAGCYLIDPLPIKDWSPLARLFENPSVTKVFHACAEDLEVCRQLTGTLPAPLADSQMAAAMAGLGGSMGFQRLVNEMLGIEIPKEATRSNWLMRPLSEDQIRYAIADVHYLHQIYPMLVERLQQQGRLEWLQEDCARIIQDLLNAELPQDYYRRIKLAWKLRPQEQYVLQQLALWREYQARERDVPRNKVIDDNTLWNLARYKPKSRDQLSRAGMRPEAIRTDGARLLGMIQEFMDDDESLWPGRLERPLGPEQGQWIKIAREAVAKRAEMLNIPPEILTRKKSIEALLRSGLGNGQFTLPEPMTGWRRQQIGEELLALFGGLAAN